MGNEGGRIRLLLVESHEVVRTALRHLLAAQGFDIAGECASLKSALQLIGRLAPDVVLMETQLPDGNPVQSCRDIRAAFPSTRLIFLASSSDIMTRVGGILAGADAYLSKECDAESLARAIRAVASGNHILDGETLQWLRQKAGAATAGSLCTHALSPQEQKILPLVAEGMTNKEIGEALGLSHKTVKNHLSSVFQKLQVSRRAQLAAIVAGVRT
jgi:two-component system, NarL family, response regulator DevR